MLDAAHLASNRRHHVLVIEGGLIGPESISTFNRLGDVIVAVFGGNGALVVQKDVAIGIDPGFTRLCSCCIHLRALLHLIEGEQQVTWLHLLALLHGHRGDPTVNLGRHRNITDRFERALVGGLLLKAELLGSNQLNMAAHSRRLGRLAARQHRQPNHHRQPDPVASGSSHRRCLSMGRNLKRGFEPVNAMGDR